MDNDIVCFSHLRWDFVWQRPQHLMTRAAQSRRVWFVEEPKDTEGESYLALVAAAENLTVAVPMLTTGLPRPLRVRRQAQLLSNLFHGTIPDAPVHWYYTPLAREFARELPAGVVVYDCMDELSAFSGASPALQLWEVELLAAADLVFTGGASLYELKRQRHPCVHKFPSSVDVGHFNSARDELPDVDAQAYVPHPRVGFIGVIDERLDRDLLREVATLRPEYQFVLVGPVVKIDPTSLPQAPNIHYLGQQPYERLPRFLANWDVAMMPFARNDATRYISPTKTPEYLAAGRPVVSTSIRDVVTPYGDMNLVAIADTADDFARALDAAIQPAEPGWLRDVDRFLSGSSWDRTWQQMSRLVRQVQARRPVGVPVAPASLARALNSVFHS